jgi:maltooligosyltrehalose trehalohydrolase
LRAHQLTGPAQYRAMVAVLLLLPQTPMLFQGQEFGASSPFLFFADHKPELAKLVRDGRARELSVFPSVGTPETLAQLAPPDDPATFQRSKLNLAERDQPGHVELLRLHTDLLALRREEACFRRVQRRGDIDGAVIGPNAFVLRYFGDAGDDRLLCVNLGGDLPIEIAPEPLLAPPVDKRWALRWSSEDPRYGGSGTPPPETEREGWFLRGRSAVLLAPEPVERALVETRVV